jgi:hypothetical protein
LAKKNKSFEGDNVINGCLDVAGNSLFNKLQNKTEISNAIKEVQLSQNTVTRRGKCPMSLNNN